MDLLAGRVAGAADGLARLAICAVGGYRPHSAGAGGLGRHAALRRRIDHAVCWLDQGNRLDWTGSGTILALPAGVAALMIGFAVNEALAPYPWACLRVVASRNIALMLVMEFCCSLLSIWLSCTHIVIIDTFRQAYDACDIVVLQTQCPSAVSECSPGILEDSLQLVSVIDCSDLAHPTHVLALKLPIVVS